MEAPEFRQQGTGTCNLSLEVRVSGRKVSDSFNGQRENFWHGLVAARVQLLPNFTEPPLLQVHHGPPQWRAASPGWSHTGLREVASSFHHCGRQGNKGGRRGEYPVVTSASARLEHREVLLKSRYFQEQETRAKGVGGSCLEILLPEPIFRGGWCL